MKIIGIIGSKGKTSILYILENIFYKCCNVGVIGDLGIRINKNKIPQNDNMSEMIDEMKKKGVDYLIIELHHRFSLLNISFDCMVFNNIYGSNGQNEFYKQAMERSKIILLNGDDEGVLSLIKGIKDVYVITYGLKNKNTITATSISLLNDRMTFVYYIQRGFITFYNNEVFVQEIPLELYLMGYQHIYNSLAAVTAGIFFNVSINDIFNGISKINSVPDRLELYAEESHNRFFIDNSNDFNSLKVIFDTLQYLTYKKILLGIYAENFKDLLYTSECDELFEELKINQIESINIVGRSTKNIDEKQLKLFITGLAKNHINVNHYKNIKEFIIKAGEIVGKDDMVVWIGPRKYIIESIRK